MPILTISLDLPEGTRVSIKGIEGMPIETDRASGTAASIEKYWNDCLSDNGRKVFGAAARLEDVHGPGYTLEDIAQTLSLDYESVKSMHRSSGRTAKLWRNEQGTEAPIRLELQDYAWEEGPGGQRAHYYLPPGVADTILALL